MAIAIDVPILTAYFSYSGSCLYMNEGTIVLPTSPDNMLRLMKTQHKTCGQAEAQWKKVFWQNDIALNTQIEQPRVLKKPDQLNRISFDGYERDSFGRVVKIVQFFGKSGREYLSNQALVTYYYNNKELCCFQICINLKHTLTEIEQFETTRKATAMECRAFMGWYLAGNSMFENPFGFSVRGKPLDYFRAYRFAYTFDGFREDDEVYRKYEDCFVHENGYEILDNISDSLFYEMYEKDIDDDLDDDLDDCLGYDPDDPRYKMLCDPNYDPTEDTDDGEEIQDWIEELAMRIYCVRPKRYSV